MNRKLNSSEQEELKLQKFTNVYKNKNMQEIIATTLEIKTSDISPYERTLLDIIRSGIQERSSIGMLVKRQIVLERLIDANSPAKKELTEYLQKVLTLLRK